VAADDGYGAAEAGVRPRSAREGGGRLAVEQFTVDGLDLGDVLGVTAQDAGLVDLARAGDDDVAGDDAAEALGEGVGVAGAEEECVAEGAVGAGVGRTRLVQPVHRAAEA